jgi:N-acetylglucosamine-6-sulfatase
MMKKQNRLWELGSFGVGAAIAVTQLTAAESEKSLPLHKQPNILLIMADDHANHAISAYGSKINKTPNIDRIAAQGALFEHAFCANAICGPSRACLISGKHSSANGFFTNRGRPFNFKQSTLIKSLNKVGYQTALVGKWHLGRNNYAESGLDYWSVWHGGYYNPKFITKEGSKYEKGYSTTLITDKTIKWIDQCDTNSPFMAICTFNAPHRSWDPEVKYLNLYKDVTIPEPETLFDNWTDKRSNTLRYNHMSIDKHFYYSYDLKVFDEVPFASQREKRLKSYAIRYMSPEDRKAWMAAYGPENREFIKNHPTGKALVRWKYQRYIKDYLRCVRSVDDSVGRMLDFLDKKGLLENTIVIYTSDQGFYLGEHGWYDKRWMFEESLRIPFIISWPGVTKPGKRYEQMIQNIDIAPTLINAAGGEIPEDMQGMSFLPILKEKNPKWRDAIYYHYFESGGEHNVPAHEGVRTARYKLINFYRNDGYNLFDLKKDPKELNNVIRDPEYAEVTKTLKTKLEELRKQYNEPPLPAPKKNK